MKPMYVTSGPATGTPVAYVFILFCLSVCPVSRLSRNLIGWRDQALARVPRIVYNSTNSNMFVTL